MKLIAVAIALGIVFAEASDLSLDLKDGPMEAGKSVITAGIYNQPGNCSLAFDLGYGFPVTNYTVNMDHCLFQTAFVNVIVPLGVPSNGTISLSCTDSPVNFTDQVKFSGGLDDPTKLYLDGSYFCFGNGTDSSTPGTASSTTTTGASSSTSMSPVTASSSSTTTTSEASSSTPTNLTASSSTTSSSTTTTAQSSSSTTASLKSTTTVSVTSITSSLASTSLGSSTATVSTMSSDGCSA